MIIETKQKPLMFNLCIKQANVFQKEISGVLLYSQEKRPNVEQ